MLAMDVSTENAIAYVCIALVLIFAGACATVLIALGKLPPPRLPHWWTGRK